MLLTLLVYNPLVMFVPSFFWGDIRFGVGFLIIWTFVDLYFCKRRGDLHHLVVFKPHIKVKSLIGISIPRIHKKGFFENYDQQVVKMKLYKNGNTEIVEGMVYKEWDTLIKPFGNIMPEFKYYLLHNNKDFKGNMSTMHIQTHIRSTFFDNDPSFMGYVHSWELDDSHDTHSEVLIEDISHEFSEHKLK